MPDLWSNILGRLTEALVGGAIGGAIGFLIVCCAFGLRYSVWRLVGGGRTRVLVGREVRHYSTRRLVARGVRLAVAIWRLRRVSLIQSCSYFISIFGGFWTILEAIGFFFQDSWAQTIRTWNEGVGFWILLVLSGVLASALGFRGWLAAGERERECAYAKHSVKQDKVDEEFSKLRDIIKQAVEVHEFLASCPDIIKQTIGEMGNESSKIKIRGDGNIVNIRGIIDTTVKPDAEKGALGIAYRGEVGSRIVEFYLFNSGQSVVVVETIELELVDVKRFRVPTQPELVIIPHRYEIRLKPDQKLYRVTGESFKYAPGDIDQFVVNMRRSEPGWEYTFRFKFHWFDILDQEQHILVTQPDSMFFYDVDIGANWLSEKLAPYVDEEPEW